MKFIDESKSFDELIEKKGLKSGDISLWYALFHKCNRLKWPAWFSVTNSELQTRAGFRSTRSIHDHRNKLKQKGFIDFKPDGANATFYHLNSPTSMQNVPGYVPGGVPGVVPGYVPGGVPHYKDKDLDKDINQSKLKTRTRENNPIPIFSLNGEAKKNG